jgi:hypothetical protein
LYTIHTKAKHKKKESNPLNNKEKKNIGQFLGALGFWCWKRTRKNKKKWKKLE